MKKERTWRGLRVIPATSVNVQTRVVAYQTKGEACLLPDGNKITYIQGIGYVLTHVYNQG